MTEAKIDRQAFITSDRGGLLDKYQVSNVSIGTGTYGSVIKAEDKVTKVVRACKGMKRSNIKNEARFREEIAIMKRMDHPNIVRLFETFEDHKNIYLILELCSGGELFDAIVSSGFLNEKEASKLVRQILSAIFYMHTNGIMHRDLKPENFLFATKEKGSTLKVIDFGLGAKFNPGDYMTTKAGTPYYVSPQVLKGKYNEKCDVWSAGVIGFILMSGYPPFYGEKDAEILAKVRKGAFSFPTEEDDGVKFTASAEDLLSKMLAIDETKRLSAEQALEHKWLHQALKADGTVKVNAKAMSNLKNWASQQRFKKIALTAIATQLNEVEIKSLKDTFQLLDANGDGSLTLDEVKSGCEKHQVTLPDGFEEIFKQLDSDGSGQVDYTEFIAATMDEAMSRREDLLWAAFRVFDIDGDGSITMDELSKVISNVDAKELPTTDAAELEALMKKYDTDGNGVIDFEEFKAMMQDRGD